MTLWRGSAAPKGIRIGVLGGFRFHCRPPVPDHIPIGTQRLLALLALHDGAIGRSSFAGTIWPDVAEDRAGACLRSALARLDDPIREAVAIDSAELALGARVSVDLRDARGLAYRLLEEQSPERSDLGQNAVSLLSAELLPGWYEDWVVTEAEEWRQLRVHALEALACRLIAGRRCGDAILAAFAAVRADPLRESARCVLVRAHLAEGNQSEAIAEYRRYRALLHDELELEPTPALRELVGRLIAS